MTHNKKTILFLHGFFSSGQCTLARVLTDKLADLATVLTPDLPTRPFEALNKIKELCKQQSPDMLVGNSCGAFYAQMVASELHLPALLGNPYFMMTEFLTSRIGIHSYNAPRQDGNQSFVIDQTLIDQFASLQPTQFDHCPTNPHGADNIWGLFGEHDHLAHYEPMFLKHFIHAYHFPGDHTPTAQEAADYYAPLVIKMLQQLLD